MGYNKRPGTVEKYAYELEQIKAALDAGKHIEFPATEEHGITKLRDKLHWILGCAKEFTEEERGRFSDLRDRATVSVDWGRRVVIVRPKAASLNPLQSRVSDESDAFAELMEVEASAHLIQFKPSPAFDPESFDRKLNAKGWTIRAQADDPGDTVLGIPPRKAGEFHSAASKAEGWRAYIATRIQEGGDKPKAFDLLEGYSQS